MALAGIKKIGVTLTPSTSKLGAINKPNQTKSISLNAAPVSKSKEIFKTDERPTTAKKDTKLTNAKEE